MPQGNWIDISIPNYKGMVSWPGDPEVNIFQVQDIAKGDVCNLTSLAMSAHTGTHMDSPRHFIGNGESMCAWRPDISMGPCRVIPIEDPEAVRAAELERFDPRQGEILLFKTANSDTRYASSDFHKDYVYVAQDAARLLVERGVKTVGIDYMSIGGFHQDLVETHVILLGAGIWVIEGINLAEVEPGGYELCCLPLRLQGCDGAPARAVLRPLG